LDAEDYISARKLLADSCEYEVRGTLIEGVDLIIASYQENGEAGRKRFDQVVYESSVSSLGNNRARIDDTDRVTHGGDTHVHRCAQEIAWDESGKIIKVLHIDLPDEIEAQDTFKQSHPRQPTDEQDASGKDG